MPNTFMITGGKLDFFLAAVSTLPSFHCHIPGSILEQYMFLFGKLPFHGLQPVSFLNVDLPQRSLLPEILEVACAALGREGSFDSTVK